MKTKINVWFRLAIEFVLFFIVYIFAGGFNSFFETINSPVLAFLGNIGIIIGMVGLYALNQFLLEKRSFSSMFQPLSIVKKTAGGFGVGAAFMSLVVGVMALCGCYAVESFQFDFYHFYSYLIGFLIVAMGEEYIFRGIVFARINERFGLVAGMAVSGLLFGLIHIMNANATLWSSIAIAIEAGLMLAAAYVYSGSIWFAIGIHWAWNYFEGYVYGTAVSGGKMSSLLTASVSGNEYISGGAFGPENSVIAVVLGSLLTVFFLMKRPKQAAKVEQTETDSIEKTTQTAE